MLAWIEVIDLNGKAGGKTYQAILKWDGGPQGGTEKRAGVGMGIGAYREKYLLNR